MIPPKVVKGDLEPLKSRIWWNCDPFLKTLNIVEMSLTEVCNSFGLSILFISNVSKR